MNEFVDKRTGEVKQAFSIRCENNKVYIKFNENSKEYGYNKENIEIILPEKKDITNNLIVYCYEKECYRCHKQTHILTYIIFEDGTYESMTFPWDKKRALKNQHDESHFYDSSIEYYGIKTIGRCPVFDEIMLTKFPDRIAVKFSQTLKAPSPMNLCEHCGAGQGQNYVYRDINKIIKKMIPLDIIKY